MSEVGDIGRKAGRGLRWSLLGNLVMKAGSFVMSLVLARLLVPEDFGVFAIALAATQFVIYINDAGVIAATVQWRGRLSEIAPTATVVAILSSFALYALFWVIAPFYARLAGSEDAIWVIRILMATNLVYGLTAVRSAALMRRFEQDKLALANLAGFVANASVSITLAANGAGAYSFAWGQLSGGVLTGVLVVALARVKIEFGFDRAQAARLLRFGLPLCVSLGIEGLLLNVDSVIVYCRLVLWPRAVAIFYSTCCDLQLSHWVGPALIVATCILLDVPRLAVPSSLRELPSCLAYSTAFTAFLPFLPAFPRISRPLFIDRCDARGASFGVKRLPLCRGFPNYGLPTLCMPPCLQVVCAWPGNCALPVTHAVLAASSTDILFQCAHHFMNR
ncbi:hypothetical protein GCM10020220_080070 [Nonomuraea rubra]|uniref:oligosaccharide flippase family protein n=1 Tax=Nonomuraea rubra TaxID=46180 RepID=UPI0031EB6868